MFPYCPSSRIWRKISGRSSGRNRYWLLLDSRGVDVLRLANFILVTLASLQPFFFHGLKKAWHFSDHGGA
jgi:hypothetical protein